MQPQQVKQVIYKQRAEPWQLLVFQMLAYCHFNNLKGLSMKHIETLSLLCLESGRYTASFCNELADRGIFKTANSARNYVYDLIEHNLITRSGKDKKILIVNPAIKYSAEPNILLNYNIVAIGTPEPPSFVQEPELKQIKNIVKI